MKKFILTLLAALAVPMTAFAANPGGGIGTGNVQSELRTLSYTLVGVPQPVAGDLTPGLDGVIVSAALNEGSTAAGTSVVITSIDTTVAGAMPFPARVFVTLIDTGSDSTLACTSAHLYGRDQFGSPVDETITTIDETAITNSTVAKSLNAYGVITRVTATGCSGGETTTDRLRVAVSRDIAIPFKITSEAAVLQVCVIDGDGTFNEDYCYRGAAADATGSPSSPNVAGAIYAFDNAGTSNRISLKYGTINLITALPSFTFTKGDGYRIRIRAPAGVK